MKLSTLKKLAQQATKFRGHSMFWSEPEKDKTFQWASCRYCGKGVAIRTNPLPNEIEIGGEAVALNCTRGDK